MTRLLQLAVVPSLKGPMRKTLAAIASVTALSAPLHAQTPVTPLDVQGHFSYDGDIPDGDGNTAYVGMDFRVVLYTLMGEPVIYCTGRWRLRSVKVDGVTYSDANVPADAWKGVDLVGVNFAFPLSLRLGGDRYGSAAVPCDPGVFHAHGDKRASFNVPGSPNWEQTLLRDNWQQAAIGLGQEARKRAHALPSAYVPMVEVKDWLAKRQASFTVDSRDAAKGTLIESNVISSSVNLWSVRSWAQEQRRIAEARKAEDKRALHAQRTARDGTVAAGPAGKLEELFTEVDAVQERRDVDRLKSQAPTGVASGKQAIEAKAARLRQGECAPDPKVVVAASSGDPTSLQDAVDQAVRRYAACDRSEILITHGREDTVFRNKQGATLLSLPRATAWGVGPVRDGLFVARAGVEEMKRFGSSKDHVVGYMNIKGEWVIPPTFENATDFSNGFALARMTGGGAPSKAFGIIGRQGQWLSERKFFCAQAFTDGAAVVSDDDGCKHDFYLIDTKGTPLFAGRMRGLRSLSNGLAAAGDSQSERRGFIDRSGRWVIAATYQYTGAFFVEGVNWVCRSWEDCDVIDASGKTVSINTLSMPLGDKFSEGLLEAPTAKASNSNNRGYVDRTGRWVIDPKFNATSQFQDGKATASVGCQRGLINRKGEWVEDPKDSCNMPSLMLLRSGN